MLLRPLSILLSSLSRLCGCGWLCLFLFMCMWARITSSAAAEPAAPQVPDEFPRFIVPGHEKEMESLRRLFWLHYRPAGPLIPLWDEWMPMSTLWPAMGSGRDLESMRLRWSAALASRGMNAEGYIHTHQHDGLAHAEGWPFPLWTQAGGIGWHFRGTGVQGYDAPPVTPEGWKPERAEGGQVGEKGWEVELTEPRSRLATPPFSVAARISPWLRLNWWAAGLEGANPYVEWTTKEAPEFSPERRAYFAPAGGGGKPDTAVIETRTMIPVYRLAGWRGTITGLRIAFDNPGPARLVIKSFHTACDTRHNINNSNFIRGCHDYFVWSLDRSFLRGQIGRIRTAMRFIQREFDTRCRKCVYTTWPGHEGRSGVRYVDGKKVVIPGEGIGSNYWDLLPFGGEDALATIYYYDALRDLADLEERIRAHPEWGVATGADAFDPEDLRRHAREVKEYGTKRFWNEGTGRFGTVDLDGCLHDYGFTFLNNEAVYHDFATPEQAKSIHAWIAGERIVEEDTSRGPDIYRWRFGPRSTTKRNIDYYFWAWSSPENIPFGYQVQDGGGVLGWSYHDLMARLKTAGPDDAARRLKEICNWFDETRAAGGYRAYYEDPARGTLQGGNVPGGLGLDKEFFESILVPQVMLYGFLGFRPTAEGCEIAPRLPGDWPSLAITRIHLHDRVLDISVSGKEIRVDAVSGEDQAAGGRALEIEVPPGWTVRGQATAAGAQRASGPRVDLLPPGGIGERYRFAIETPDEDIDRGCELAIGALWKGARTKAGIVVPTVSGSVTYPFWVHPYDNYWINRVSSYFFPRESTEWPIRLFAAYQTPTGEIGGGVYDIPEAEWWERWEEAGGPVKWQPRYARPLADHVASLAMEPRKIQYGIYVRDHLFVLQVYDQWRASGSLPFLIEMYGPCRRALKYLEEHRDADRNGLVETTCVLSDLVVAGDQDAGSTERAEDQVMLFGALRTFAEMARKLGGTEDAAWAERWAGRIKDETIKRFWRPEGRLIFGVERDGKKPRLEYVTTTYADGYAVLFGIADEAQGRAILDFMARQEFVVPGPYHIPPVRAEDKPQNPPGVYCNGGCGWGRGIMPSVALACFELGRIEQGFDYLKRQAAAARKAGSFHEYWTWEKYAGKTEPGGAPWYGETSAGFLDALLHGLFGISSTEPGYATLRLAPRFPEGWDGARLELALPGGERLPCRKRLAVTYRSGAQGRSLAVETEGPTPVEVILPWTGAGEPRVDGVGLADPRIEGAPGAWKVTARIRDRGELRLAP